MHPVLIAYVVRRSANYPIGSGRIFGYSQKIREFIKKRSPDVKIVPYTEFPNIYGVKEDVLIEQLKDEGCDAIIVGNAA